MTVISSKTAEELLGDIMWRNLNARFNMFESSLVGNEESLGTRKEGRATIRLPLI